MDQRVNTVTIYGLSRLGGVNVSVLAIGNKVSGYKHGRGDGFLRAIRF